MKKFIYPIVLVIALMSALSFAACTKGGNVDDSDGSVSTDMTSSETTSNGMIGDIVSDIKEDVGMNNSSTQSSSK